MNAFVLYHPKTRTTGRAIAALLGVPSGTKCKHRKYENISHIIRWGNIRPITALYRNGDHFEYRTEINTRAAVTLAGSKFRALEALQTAGVPVPEFTRTWRVATEWVHEGITVFGRKFRHMGGKDIVVVEGGAPDLRDVYEEAYCDYYTKYVEPHKEYRIHVFDGKILHAQKKYFGEELFADIVAERFCDGDRTTALIRMDYGEWDAFREECMLIRNNAHAWRFYDVKDSETVPERVKDAALQSVKALGLTFGAVDVISLKDKDEDGKRKAVVLEVNTAPGLRDRNLEVYVEAFKQKLA